jgi:hypothetical protein
LTSSIPPYWQPYLASFWGKSAKVFQLKSSSSWTDSKGPILNQEEAKMICSLLLFSLSLLTRFNRSIWSTFFLSEPKVEKIKVLKVKKSNGELRKRSKDEDATKMIEKKEKEGSVRKRKSTKG